LGAASRRSRWLPGDKTSCSIGDSLKREQRFDLESIADVAFAYDSATALNVLAGAVLDVGSGRVDGAVAIITAPGTSSHGISAGV